MGSAALFSPADQSRPADLPCRGWRDRRARFEPGCVLGLVSQPSGKRPSRMPPRTAVFPCSDSTSFLGLCRVLGATKDHVRVPSSSSPRRSCLPSWTGWSASPSTLPRPPSTRLPREGMDSRRPDLGLGEAISCHPRDWRRRRAPPGLASSPHVTHPGTMDDMTLPRRCKHVLDDPHSSGKGVAAAELTRDQVRGHCLDFKVGTEWRWRKSAIALEVR